MKNIQSFGALNEDLKVKNNKIFYGRSPALNRKEIYFSFIGRAEFICGEDATAMKEIKSILVTVFNNDEQCQNWVNLYYDTLDEYDGKDVDIDEVIDSAEADFFKKLPEVKQWLSTYDK